MSKPLLKTQYCNLPLSIPAPWRDFFQDNAQLLGISRNAAMCLALKLGGPILEKYILVMRSELKGTYERIGRAGLSEAPLDSEILGATRAPAAHGKALGHERTNKPAKRR